MINLDFLFKPVEELDDSLANLFEGAPLAVALGIAFLLGLRHATDPDHLMAVTALVARDDSGTRSAARLGAVWGAGHATALLLIGLPLILLGTALPPALESTAEKAVGVVIILLAVRVLVRWVHRNAGTTTTGRCARRARRSESDCCTASPAPARSCCC